MRRAVGVPVVEWGKHELRLARAPRVRLAVNESLLVRGAPGVVGGVRRELARRLQREVEGLLDLDPRDIRVDVIRNDPEKPESTPPPFIEWWLARWEPAVREVVVVVDGRAEGPYQVASIHDSIKVAALPGPATVTNWRDTEPPAALNFNTVTTECAGWDPHQRLWVYRPRTRGR